MTILLIAICAFMNHARGNHFWNKLSSTVESRAIAMAVITAFCGAVSENIIVIPIVFLGLMLWCTPAWDKYWSAAIGNDPVHSKLWGTVTMGLRGTLIYPMFIALGYFINPIAYLVGVASLLQGAPYYLGGVVTKKFPSIPPISFAEYVWGACIGAMLSIVLI